LEIPVTVVRSYFSGDGVSLHHLRARSSPAQIDSLHTEYRVHNCEEANRSIDPFLILFQLGSEGLGVGGDLERARRAGAGELLELIRAALASQRKQRPESGGAGKSYLGTKLGMEPLDVLSDVVERGFRRIDFPSAAGMGDSTN
jgi:hypothetical protein